MTPDDAPPLIPAAARPDLARALQETLAQRDPYHGSMGELEPLGVRIGLIQGTLRPRLRQPQLLVFAGDHGLAVDVTAPGDPGTERIVDALLTGRTPLPAMAHRHGLHFHLVDSGLATPLGARPGVISRKIAHGTRNARLAPAMSVDQVQSAIRAGMEITQDLPGNVLGVAGLGVGSAESAALLINRLAGSRLQDLLSEGPSGDPQKLEQRLLALQAAQSRHFSLDDPIDVLAAFGGFETAMMVGAMLIAASQRRLILIDGLSACAALLVASRVGGPALSDYCIFTRSTGRPGLDEALRCFEATAILELGMEALDGTGIAVSWPILASAASLLSDVTDDSSADATRPDELLPLSDADVHFDLTAPCPSSVPGTLGIPD